MIVFTGPYTSVSDIISIEIHIMIDPAGRTMVSLIHIHVTEFPVHASRAGYHQESVLITEDKVRAYYINQTLPLDS